MAGFQLDLAFMAKTNRCRSYHSTAEYAAKLKYSDVFFFVDQQWDGNDDDSTYFELAPRLSLGETTGQNLSFGPVKDVLYCNH